MRDKKGQAAMEFLMTYGWAILAAIVVIGLIGYYVFNTDLMGDPPSGVSSPFHLEESNVLTTGVNLVIRNNVAETNTITEIDVDGCGTESYSTDLNSGESELFTINCTLSEGSSFNGDITITYQKQGGLLNQTSTGSIAKTVQ